MKLLCGIVAMCVLAEGARVRMKRKVSPKVGPAPLSASPYKCADPLAAIKKTMDCLEAKDSSCVNDGYNWLRFNKYHNGNNVGLQLWPFDIYWSMALKFSTFQLIYDHAQNVGTNRASVRYREVIVMS